MKNAGGELRDKLIHGIHRESITPSDARGKAMSLLPFWMARRVIDEANRAEANDLLRRL